MQIGELAKQAGCTVEGVRFYEQEKLLPPPHRLANGYRDYQAAHLERLTFIRRCRDLGISLKDIARLLAFSDDPQPHCDAVNTLIDTQIEHLQRKLGEMQTLQTQLVHLRRQCRGGETACGILQELQQTPHV